MKYFLIRDIQDDDVPYVLVRQDNAFSFWVRCISDFFDNPIEFRRCWDGRFSNITENNVCVHPDFTLLGTFNASEELTPSQLKHILTTEHPELLL